MKVDPTQQFPKYSNRNKVLTRQAEFTSWPRKTTREVKVSTHPTRSRLLLAGPSRNKLAVTVLLKRCPGKLDNS